MLRIKNLKAGYGGNVVIKGINLNVKRGEIVSILGPNGSGKSTSLKSIFNLCDIYSGSISWDNKDITKLKTHEKISEGISYVPQGRQIFRDLTVQENLEMGAFTIKDKKLVKSNLREVYKKFPFLKKSKFRYAHYLSGGQQQLLSIGRALIQNPKLLLLDEPSLGLSPKSMNIVFKKIKEINKEGVTVVIVEQNIKQAIRLANRNYVLERGKIVLVDGKNILKNHKIKSIYFGRG
jgi:branched-chain amino acid transport system ATP-binding protein